MTILFDATRPVKSTRSARRFGAGLFQWTPMYHADHTAADEAWLIEDNARREAESRLFDRMAAESRAVARHERGLCF
jgi:hypothetical protein